MSQNADILNSPYWGAAPVIQAQDETLNQLSEISAIGVITGEIALFLQTSHAEGLGRRHLLASFVAGSTIAIDQLVLPPGWRCMAVALHDATVRIVKNVSTTGSFVSSELLQLNRQLREATARTPWFATGATTLTEVDYSTVVNLATASISHHEQSEDKKLHSRPHDEQKQLKESFYALSRVADANDEHEAGAHDIELLDQVIRKVATTIGSKETPTNGEALRETWIRERIESIGARARILQLEDSWYKWPSLCMVGFLDDDKTPVALIPGFGSYKLYNPRTGKTTKVTSRTAQRLAATAYAIYPTFPPGPITPWKMLGFSVRQIKSQIQVHFALAAAAAFISLLTPIMVGIVFNKVLPNEQFQLLVGVAAMLAGAAIVALVIDISKGISQAHIEGRMSSVDEGALMDRVMTLSTSFMRGYNSGDLGARINGMYYVRTRGTDIVLSTGIMALVSIANLALLFFYSAPMAIVAILVLLALLSVVAIIDAKWIKYQKAQLDQEGIVDSNLFEWIRSIQKIQVAGAEQRVMARWAKDFRVLQLKNIQAGRMGSWSISLLHVTTGILALALYTYAGLFLVGDLSGGSYLAFWTALGQFTVTVMALASTLEILIQIVGRWDRLKPILEQDIETFGSQDPGKLSGKISLNHVEFAYSAEDRKILDNININIKPGQLIALTGTSGCGKSTILRLLLGLEKPTAGSVTYDDVDLEQLDIRLVRKQIGTVMQQSRPLPGDLASIILGDSGGTLDDAWEAAQIAGLADDIRQMPKGMETSVGEQASAFSGGQVQRLMIARLFAQKPGIILLDEATSALDDETQRHVSDNLDRLAATRIVVAHRLSTIRNADQIFVLDNGKIVQQGNFDELMDSQGVFHNLVSRQLTSDQLDALAN